jgi:hypothetical protein
MSRVPRRYQHFMKTTRGIVGALALLIGGQAKATAAASAAVHDSAVEATLDSVAFAANELGQAGTVIDFEIQGIATATVGTDTLTIKVKLGTTVILTLGPTDVANNNIWHVRGKIIIRTTGSGGTMVACGTTTALAAAGTAAIQWNLASTAIDTTVAQTFAVTATWSTGNANSCRNDVFVVNVVG